MYKCAVCNHEWNTALDAFLCETDHRERIDNTERQNMLYRVDIIRDLTRSINKFSTKGYTVIDYYGSARPYELHIITVQFINSPFKGVERVIQLDPIPRDLLPSALEQMKEMWKGVLQAELVDFLKGNAKRPDQKFARMYQEHYMTIIDKLLKEIDDIDNNFWDTLNRRRRTALTLPSR